MAFINGNATSETLNGDIDLNINDAINGQQGDDTLNGLTGNDSLSGQDGDDDLNGAGGIDTLFGGDGEDDLDGGEANDTQHGDEGGDDLLGGGGDDLLDGGRDDDDLFGHDGTDTLIGDRGDDDLDGGRGADTMTGGRGFDLFTWAAWRNGSENDYFFDATDDDVITDFRPTIDLIDVSSFASDFATVQAIGQTVGNDTVFTIFENGLPATLTLLGVKLNQLTAADFEFDNAGLGDTLVGTAGNDDLFGGFGGDSLNGGAGNDRLFGEQGSDVLAGSIGNDRIWGGIGNDVLLGQAGVDVLRGGDGNDVVRGGTDQDTLNGGLGVDTFEYDTLADSAVGPTKDIIQDFVTGTDKVDLTTIDADSGLAGDQAFTFLGAGAFTGAAGQLRYNGNILIGDVNGDSLADFSIEFLAAPSIAAGDLIL